MNKTLIPALALLIATALAGCATSAPRELAAAQPDTLNDAGTRHTWSSQLQCPAPANDNSLHAARCARAQLMRSVGPSVPTLGF